MDKESYLKYFPEMFILLTVTLFTMCLFVLKPALLPFFIASAIAYTSHPVFNFLTKKTGKKKISALTTIMLMFILISLLIFFVIPAIAEQFQSFLRYLPKLVGKIDQMLYHMLGKHYLRIGHISVENIQKLVQDLYTKTSVGDTFSITDMLKKLFSGMFSVIGVVINIIVIPIITYYYLVNAHKIKEVYMKIPPRKYRKDTERLFNRVHNALANYLLGQVMIAVFVGIYLSTGLSIVGIKYSILIGALAGILNMVPYVGFFSGFIPSILLAIFDNGDLYHIMGVIVVFLSEAAIENVLYPVVMSKTTGVSPLLVLLAVFIGGIYGGILGIIISVPLIVMIVPIFLSAMEKRENHVNWNNR